MGMASVIHQIVISKATPAAALASSDIPAGAGRNQKKTRTANPPSIPICLMVVFFMVFVKRFTPSGFDAQTNPVHAVYRHEQDQGPEDEHFP